MDRLTDIIRNYSEEENITEASDFKKDLGIASFDAVCMTAEINKVFGINIDPTAFVKHRSVGEMWAYISSLI